MVRIRGERVSHKMIWSVYVRMSYTDDNSGPSHLRRRRRMRMMRVRWWAGLWRDRYSASRSAPSPPGTPSGASQGRGSTGSLAMLTDITAGRGWEWLAAATARVTGTTGDKYFQSFVNITTVIIFRDLPGCPFWHQTFPRSRFKEIFGARPEVEQILERNSLLFSNK